MKDNPVFVDTNIIVYAYDLSEPQKRKVCKELLKTGFMEEKQLCISNQVLAELAFVLHKKIQKPLPKKEIKEIVSEITQAENWKKINYNNETVLKTVDALEEKEASFWDALIAETMKENNITAILTENTKDFDKIAGIKTINPFKQ